MAAIQSRTEPGLVVAGLDETTELTLVPSDPPLRAVRVWISTAARSNRRLVSVIESVVGLDRADTAADLADVHIVNLDELTTSCSRAVVVVAATTDLSSHRAALASGAAALLDGWSTRSDVEIALRAARAGRCVIPSQHATNIAVRLEEPPPGLRLSVEEMQLLQGIASGFTVEELAALHGCSERHLRRRLRSVWAGLGVSGRAPGLVRAARWGLVC